MAVKRVSAGRRRQSTRTANPGTSAGAKKAWATRRKKKAARSAAAKKAWATRKRATRKPATRKKRSTAIVRRKATTPHKRKRGPQKRRTTRRVALRSKSTRRPVSITVRANPKRRRRSGAKRNGAGLFMLPILGGVDTGAVAVGSLVAIVLKNAFKNVGFIRDQLDKLPESVKPFVGPALIVGLGYAANKYSKNRHVKALGAYAAAAAIVLAVDDFADAKIAEKFQEWSNVGGTHLSYGGAHIQLRKMHGLQGSGMGGTHLQLKSGASGMFGGISNLA